MRRRRRRPPRRRRRGEMWRSHRRPPPVAAVLAAGSTTALLFLLLYHLPETEADGAGQMTMADRVPILDKLVRLLTGQHRRDLLKVCYGRYGCFSLDYPWLSTRRLINVVPKSPSVIWPNFLLYTRSNPRRPHKLVEDDENALRRSRFDKNKMTFVITHGYLEHGTKDWLQQMKDELVRNGDHNVIIVDWLTASRPPYHQAANNIRVIGVQTAHFLAFLAARGGADLMHVHMVGHSLGAHLCGYVGNTLQTRFGLMVGRISGLDPAAPHFEWADPVTRLDPSDAYFVDVIHSDASPLLSSGLGVYQPCGHLDFYPNGGMMMAGCDRTVVGSLRQENGSLGFGLRRFLGCNHFRSYEYFIESINGDCPFTGVECDSFEAFVNGQCDGCLMGEEFRGCEFMGFSAFSTLNGSRPQFENKKLFLLTEPEKPFCSWPFSVRIVLSDTPESMRQRGDRGNFYIKMHGEDVTSEPLLLNPKEAYFESGRVYNFLITTRKLGHVHSADLIWEYAFHPLNPLTWRVFSDSKVFVNRVEIEKFGGGKRHVFCGEDRPFFPGRPQHVEWMPTCRDNKPDPGESLLGSVLNADPVGNAGDLLHHVNPLAMNPLNGLSSIGNAFGGFTRGVQGMGAAIRRAGAEVRRSFVAGEE